MGAYFDCMDCVFATNSPKRAQQHREDTGHRVDEEADE